MVYYDYYIAFKIVPFNNIKNDETKILNKK